MNTSEEVICITTRAWLPSMAPEEYGAFLNRLLEAERAGAKLLSAYLDELPPDSFRWQSMRAVQLDEARNCAVLIHLLLEAQVTPSTAVGDFYDKGLAMQGFPRKIAVPQSRPGVGGKTHRRRPAASAGKRATRAAGDVRLSVVNIRDCEALL